MVTMGSVCMSEKQRHLPYTTFNKQFFITEMDNLMFDDRTAHY
jgi:hypothetical protein